MKPKSAAECPSLPICTVSYKRLSARPLSFWQKRTRRSSGQSCTVAANTCADSHHRVCLLQAPPRSQQLAAGQQSAQPLQASRPSNGKGSAGQQTAGLALVIPLLQVQMLILQAHLSIQHRVKSVDSYCYILMITMLLLHSRLASMS